MTTVGIGIDCRSVGRSVGVHGMAAAFVLNCGVARCGISFWLGDTHVLLRKASVGRGETTKCSTP